MLYERSHNQAIKSCPRSCCAEAGSVSQFMANREQNSSSGSARVLSLLRPRGRVHERHVPVKDSCCFGREFFSEGKP